MKKEYLFFIILILVSILIRVIFLGHQQVWLDESISLHIAKDTLVNIWNSTDTNPPLYHFFLHVWIKLFGVDTARYLSILFGTIAVLYLYLLAKKFYKPKIAFLIAAVASAFPLLVFYSQEIRMYALFHMLAVMSWYYHYDLKKKPLQYMLVTTLMLYSHLYGLFIVAGQALYTLCTGKGTVVEKIKTRYKDILYFLVPMFVFSFWAVKLPQIMSIGSTSWLADQNMNFVYGIISLLFLLSIYFREKKKSIMLYWSSVPLAIILVSSLVFNLLSIKYIMVFLFPLFLGIKRQKLLQLLLVVFVCLTLFQSYIVTRDNWKEVGSIVDFNEPIVIISYYEASPFSYHFYPECFAKEQNYLTNICLELHGVYAPYDDLNLYKIDQDEIWLIQSRELFHEPNKEILDYLYDHYEVQEDILVRGISNIYTQPIRVQKLVRFK